jgi:hypothetical protein
MDVSHRTKPKLLRNAVQSISGLFSNQNLYIEEIQQKELGGTEAPGMTSQKNPVMVAAGKKAAMSRKANTYTVEEHVEGRPKILKELALAVQEYVMGLDTAIEQTPIKFSTSPTARRKIQCAWRRSRRNYIVPKAKSREGYF